VTVRVSNVSRVMTIVNFFDIESSSKSDSSGAQSTVKPFGLKI
jgi:hypothetical protein